jgi:D-glycero-D-manno-heptose 1,7-bisphosphate phosphatase
MISLRPAVFFLDRDGTLNLPRSCATANPTRRHAGGVRSLPGCPSPAPGSHAAGYVLVVATNQPDVGRGTQPLAVVAAMHAHLRRN